MQRTAPTISAGGTQENDGLASDTILNGGEQDTFNHASGTIVNSGGVQNVYDGCIAVKTVVNSGAQFVYAGLASTTVVNIDGVQFVDGGAAINTIVYSEQYVDNGTADLTTLNVSAAQYLDGDSFASDYDCILRRRPIWRRATPSCITPPLAAAAYKPSVISSFANDTVVNGVQNANDFARANDVTIDGGGTQEPDRRCQCKLGTVINDGGLQDLQDFATASETTINSSGTQTLNGDAVAFDTVVSGAGRAEC